MDGRRAWWLSVAAASVLAIVLRLPMLTQPMTADEGGYAGVARGWARGLQLYHDVWVDRPQGLLLLFRFVDWVDGGHAAGIRIMAIVFGVGLVWATAWAVRGLAGPAAGAVAAFGCAAATSVPTLEGFAANGELLAGAFAALCVALAVVAMRRPDWWRWALCGVAGAVAISLKQSGGDGLAAVLVWLGVLAVLGPGRRLALRRMVWVVAGAVVPLVALVVHGAIIGWDRWTMAMFAYRLRIQSAVDGADWANLRETAKIAGPVIGLLGLVALVGIVLAPGVVRRNGPPDAPRAWIVPVAWLVAAIAAFLAGGGFWRHYWVQLGAPLAALAGIAVARAARRWRIAVAAAFVIPSLIATAWVMDAPHDQWIVRANDDWRSPFDGLVADWLRANDVGDRDVYVLCASAGLYGDAALVPGYPYLWMIEVHDAPQAEQRLVAYLADGPQTPAYIVQFQEASSCDGSGRVQQLLDRDYVPVTDIGPVTILRRLDGV